MQSPREDASPREGRGPGGDVLAQQYSREPFGIFLVAVSGYHRGLRRVFCRCYCSVLCLYMNPITSFPRLRYIFVVENVVENLCIYFGASILCSIVYALFPDCYSCPKLTIFLGCFSGHSKHDLIVFSA